MLNSEASGVKTPEGSRRFTSELKLRPPKRQQKIPHTILEGAGEDLEAETKGRRVAERRDVCATKAEDEGIVRESKVKSRRFAKGAILRYTG